SIIQCRQNIAIHHEKRLVEPRNTGKGARCAQRFNLSCIREFDSVLPPISEIGHKQFGQMSNGEGELLHAMPGELTYDHVENRHIADWQQWFGENGRVRCQTGAASTSEY